MKRRLNFLLCSLALASGLLVTWSCREPARFNVLLITIDTLRADHLGYHGYQRDTSPFLDGFAAESVAFMNAGVQVPKTVPSLASILSARYPAGSSVLSNHHKLPQRVLTLAEVLASNGYATAAVTTNANLIPERGFAQGFEEFQFLSPIRNAEAVTTTALERLALGFDRDFFLWLHYIDPHGPYTPPAPYDLMFVDDQYYDADRRVELEYEPLEGYNENYVLGAVPRYVQRPLREDPRNMEADYYVARYDGEIRYLDAQLERLLEGLRSTGLLDRTIVAFTSDHGEAMGEHNYYFEHGWFVYEDQVHVPLLLRVPGSTSPERIQSEIEVINLGSTLLDYLGIDPPEVFQGSSLRPLIEGQTKAPRQRYSQTPTEELPHHHLSLRVGPWKYITGGDNHEELYNLQQDPAETRNLVAERADVVELMRQRILSGPWVDGAAESSEKLDTDELSAEVVEDLRALGYVD